jgi:hypothetical protein
MCSLCIFELLISNAAMRPQCTYNCRYMGCGSSCARSSHESNDHDHRQFDAQASASNESGSEKKPGMPRRYSIMSGDCSPMVGSAFDVQRRRATEHDLSGATRLIFSCMPPGMSLRLGPPLIAANRSPNLSRMWADHSNLIPPFHILYTPHINMYVYGTSCAILKTECQTEYFPSP